MKSGSLTGLGIVVLAAALAMGCGGTKHSIVGKWSGILGGRGGGMQSVLEFRPDGTLVQRMGAGSHAVVANAKYTSTSDTLHATVVSATVDGKPQTLPAGSNLTQIFKYKVDGNTLTLMQGTMQIALQRTN